MHVVIAFFVIIGFLGNNLNDYKKPADELNYATASTDIIRTYHSIEPDNIIKKKNIIKQAHDYSCGSAALATLLKYFLGEDVDEKKVIMGLFKYGDIERVKKIKAFSFWDMEQLIKALGYECGGYKATIEDIKNSEYWPCIIPIKLYGYSHFVVLKGIYKNHVFLADPYMGNISYTMNTFTEVWSNKVMFIVNPKDKYRSYALKLKRSDLRLIEQDTEKQLMFEFTNFQKPPSHKSNISYSNSSNIYLYKH